jgi:ADP-ribose pyrophosphatase YjhB (NUDIX family)
MTTLPEIPAVSVALVRGDTVLLVKRGRAPSQGLYAFPGGKQEPGETSEEAARRELVEETALEGTGYRPVRLTVFAAAYAGGEAVAGDDAASAAFYSLDDMRALPLAASVMEVAEELLAGTRPVRDILSGEAAS